MHIRDALEEQQREHVGLEICRIHRPAQNVRRFPQVGFKLTEGNCGSVHQGIWTIRLAMVIVEPPEFGKRKSLRRQISILIIAAEAWLVWPKRRSGAAPATRERRARRATPCRPNEPTQPFAKRRDNGAPTSEGLALVARTRLYRQFRSQCGRKYTTSTTSRAPITPQAIHGQSRFSKETCATHS